jgi:hypothetical protein
VRTPKLSNWLVWERVVVIVPIKFSGWSFVITHKIPDWGSMWINIQLPHPRGMQGRKFIGHISQIRESISEHQHSSIFRLHTHYGIDGPISQLSISRIACYWALKGIYMHEIINTLNCCMLPKSSWVITEYSLYFPHKAVSRACSCFGFFQKSSCVWKLLFWSYLMDTLGRNKGSLVCTCFHGFQDV